MKITKYLLGLLTLSAPLAAQLIDFTRFEAKELSVEDGMVHTICSFDSVDYFTTYSCTGEFLWEIPFGPKIISWQRDGDQILVLSRVRNGTAFFLSAINPMNGNFLWEKGIFAPKKDQEVLGAEQFGSLE